VSAAATIAETFATTLQVFVKTGRGDAAPCPPLGDRLSSTCVPYGRKNVLTLNVHGPMRNNQPAVKLEQAHAAELRAQSAAEPTASVAAAAVVKPRAASWESWDSTVAVLAPEKSVTPLPAVPVAVKRALLDLSPYSLILAKSTPANPYANTPSKVYKDWRVSGVLPQRKPTALAPLPGLSEGAVGDRTCGQGSIPRDGRCRGLSLERS
jgi:hypothetical protein